MAASSSQHDATAGASFNHSAAPEASVDVLSSSVFSPEVSQVLEKVWRKFAPDEFHLASLQHELRNEPDCIRGLIMRLLRDETRHAYQNVADQICKFKQVLNEMASKLEEPDMQQIQQMLMDVPDSALRSLERDASNIDSTRNYLVQCIQNNDFASLKQISEVTRRRAERFQEKLSSVYSSLTKVADQFKTLELRFSDGKQQSMKLQEQAEQHQAQWDLQFEISKYLVGGVVSVALVGLLAVEAPLWLPYLFSNAISAVATVNAGQLAQFGLNLSLACVLRKISEIGREELQALLGCVFAEEIEQHKKTAAAFEAMEEITRTAADWCRSSQKDIHVILEALECVVSKTKEMEENAEDAAWLYPPQGPAAEQMLSDHKSSMMESVDDFAEPYMQILPVVTSLQDKTRASRASLTGMPAYDHPSNLDVSPGAPGMLNQVVEPELAASSQSSSGAVSAVTDPAMHARCCLLTESCVLVPVVEASRLGRFTAVGPRGVRACIVSPQGQQERDLATIRTGNGKTTLTATHRLPVQRHSAWRAEEAGGIQAHDMVCTTQGKEQVIDVHIHKQTTPVFELDVMGDGEIFIWSFEFTPNTNTSPGQVCGPSLAVYGRDHCTNAGNSKRPSSAPPRLDDLPSEGSRFHPVDGSPCGAVCRKYQRQKGCLQGRYCAFCHFSHTGQSKRGARGPRSSKE